MLDRRTAPTAQVLKAGLQVIHVSLVRVHGEHDVLRLVLAPHGKLLVKFFCLRARRSDLELGEQKKNLHCTEGGSSGRATRVNLNLKNYDHSSPSDSSTVRHSPLCRLVLHLPSSSSRLTDAAGVGTQTDGTASRNNAQLLHRGREKTSSTSITACSIAEICVFTHLLPSSFIRNGETRSCGTRLPPTFSVIFCLRFSPWRCLVQRARSCRQGLGTTREAPPTAEQAAEAKARTKPAQHSNSPNDRP